MIVEQQGSQFIMIKQQDHALVSGEMASRWKKNFFLRSRLRKEADRAVTQHDRAWITIDEHPLWNEEREKPYSFIDYPLQEKLFAYQRGIEEVAEESLYGALLCSRHLESFFTIDSDDDMIRQFVEGEQSRQEKLKNRMEMDVPEDIFDLHLKRLQFCDYLSLYICMQQPGTPKEEELSWFKDGFSQKFDFAPDGIMAEWVDQEQVSLNPFPFGDILEVRVPYRLVSMEDIHIHGLERAYQEATVQYRRIRFIPKP